MTHSIPALDSRLPRQDRATAAGLLAHGCATSAGLAAGQSSEFAAMDSAFNRSGGLLQGDVLTLSLRKFRDQPISTLARWIVNRTLVSFTWRSQTLVPLFQFDPADMSPRQEVEDVVRELSGALSDWEIAVWFARPNALLAGAAPVDMIGSDPMSVRRAAVQHASEDADELDAFEASTCTSA